MEFLEVGEENDNHDEADRRIFDKLIKFQLANDGENPGRLYPKRGAMSLQSLKKDVRKALTYDTYTDIDMVNAHPTILSPLFAKLKIPCPLMDTYVFEREKILTETGLSRNDAKQAFISLMYGGKPRENAYPRPFLGNDWSYQNNIAINISSQFSFIPLSAAPRFT